jgi:hypothetical protein
MFGLLAAVPVLLLKQAQLLMLMHSSKRLLQYIQPQTLLLVKGMCLLLQKSQLSLEKGEVRLMHQTEHEKAMWLQLSQ